MEPEKQVTNLELSKKLKLLRVKQNSLFYWFKSFVNDEISLIYWDKTRLLDKTTKKRIICSAFTAAELGEMLPAKYCMHWKISKPIWFCAENVYEDSLSFMAKTEADARAKMLIHLVENNLIKLRNIDHKSTA